MFWKRAACGCLAAFVAVPLLACAGGVEPMVYPPVEVEVNFEKTDTGCEITYTPDTPITLYKNPDNGPNRALWTWTGAAFDRAWVVFETTDMPNCIDGHLIGESKKGFEIIRRGGTVKTVNPAGDCAPGQYDYELMATSDEGDLCGVDPRVLIDD